MPESFTQRIAEAEAVGAEMAELLAEVCAVAGEIAAILSPAALLKDIQ